MSETASGESMLKEVLKEGRAEAIAGRVARAREAGQVEPSFEMGGFLQVQRRWDEGERSGGLLALRRAVWAKYPSIVGGAREAVEMVVERGGEAEELQAYLLSEEKVMGDALQLARTGKGENEKVDVQELGLAEFLVRQGVARALYDQVEPELAGRLGQGDSGVVSEWSYITDALTVYPGCEEPRANGFEYVERELRGERIAGGETESVAPMVIEGRAGFVKESVAGTSEVVEPGAGESVQVEPERSGVDDLVAASEVAVLRQPAPLNGGEEDASGQSDENQGGDAQAQTSGTSTTESTKPGRTGNGTGRTRVRIQPRTRPPQRQRPEPQSEKPVEEQPVERTRRLLREGLRRVGPEFETLTFTQIMEELEWLAANPDVDLNSDPRVNGLRRALLVFDGLFGNEQQLPIARAMAIHRASGNYVDVYNGALEYDCEAGDLALARERNDFLENGQLMPELVGVSRYFRMGELDQLQLDLSLALTGQERRQEMFGLLNTDGAYLVGMNRTERISFANRPSVLRRRLVLLRWGTRVTNGNLVGALINELQAKLPNKTTQEVGGEQHTDYMAEMVRFKEITDKETFSDGKGHLIRSLAAMAVMDSSLIDKARMIAGKIAEYVELRLADFVDGVTTLASANAKRREAKSVFEALTTVFENPEDFFEILRFDKFRIYEPLEMLLIGSGYRYKDQKGRTIKIPGHSMRRNPGLRSRVNTLTDMVELYEPGGSGRFPPAAVRLVFEALGDRNMEKFAKQRFWRLPEAGGFGQLRELLGISVYLGELIRAGRKFEDIGVGELRNWRKARHLDLVVEAAMGLFRLFNSAVAHAPEDSHPMIVNKKAFQVWNLLGEMTDETGKNKRSRVQLLIDRVVDGVINRDRMQIQTYRDDNSRLVDPESMWAKRLFPPTVFDLWTADQFVKGNGGRDTFLDVVFGRKELVVGDLRDQMVFRPLQLAAVTGSAVFEMTATPSVVDTWWETRKAKDANDKEWDMGWLGELEAKFSSLVNPMFMLMGASGFSEAQMVMPSAFGGDKSEILAEGRHRVDMIRKWFLFLLTHEVFDVDEVTLLPRKPEIQCWLALQVLNHSFYQASKRDTGPGNEGPLRAFKIKYGELMPPDYQGWVEAKIATASQRTRLLLDYVRKDRDYMIRYFGAADTIMYSGGQHGFMGRLDPELLERDGYPPITRENYARAVGNIQRRSFKISMGNGRQVVEVNAGLGATKEDAQKIFGGLNTHDFTVGPNAKTLQRLLFPLGFDIKTSLVIKAG